MDSRKKLLIIETVAVILLIGVAIGAALMISKMRNGTSEQSVTEYFQSDPVPAETTGTGSGESSGSAADTSGTTTDRPDESSAGSSAVQPGPDDTRSPGIIDRDPPSDIPAEDSLTVTYVSGTKDVWTLKDGVLTIGRLKADSEYSLSGVFHGSVVVDIGDSYKLDLNFEGLTLVSGTRCPVVILSGDGVDISAKSGTSNFIYDTRKRIPENSEEYSSAVWSDCDTKLKGKGSLTVISKNNNGIHSKDDLDVKNLTLSVLCTDNALKGNDSVNIESGNITLIATGGDGIKTTNSDISAKGNQRGAVTVSGGSVTIYSASDGIDAAYDVLIGETASVTVFTDTYSEYTGDIKTGSGSKYYLYIPASIYAGGYRYAFMFYNSDTDVKWSDCEPSATLQGGFGRPSAYVYTFSIPSGYGSFKLFRFTSAQTENSTSLFNASTSGGAVNPQRNAFGISSVSGGVISGSWGEYTAADAMDHSSKGIKSHNEIVISGGTVSISSNDDCIHANGGEKLENKATGTGDVTLSGGTLTLQTNDDAVHADGRLYVKGGSVHVVSSYEGYEANGIEISGGETDIYAKDDGVNASGKAFSPYVKVSGGILRVTVGSGDTDGIDVNGSYTQTGGYVITQVKNSTSGMSSGLDLDGTCRISGGTAIVTGSGASTPSSGSCPWVRFGSSSGGRGGMGGRTSSGIKFPAGTYTVKDSSGAELFSFVLESECHGLWMASDSFKTGSSYNLSGPVSRNWTQTGSSVTVSQ